MAKRTAIEEEFPNKIYRIPTKKGYTKTRMDKTRTWKDTYGKGKCVKCKKHFQEMELYTCVGNNSEKFQHVDCKHPKNIE
jgi:hypothetical protein